MLRGHDGDELRCVLHDEGRDGAGVVFPGAGYAPHAPLLYYARRALGRRSLAVLEVWWDYRRVPQDVPDGLLEEWIGEDALAALAAVEDYDPLVLVGKSLGTIALATLFRTGDLGRTPSIWLTPLLGREAVRKALASLAAPALVALGTADPFSDPALLPRGRFETLVVEGADHGLELPDPVASVDALRRVVEAMARFL